MVPRSYMFSAAVRAQSSERRGSKSTQTDSARSRSTPASASEPDGNCSTASRKASEPVSIPTNNPMHRSIRHGVASTALHTGRHVVGRSRRPADVHDSNSLPPAVAALLAVTTIPPPKRRQIRHHQSTVKISIDELVQEWRSEVDQPSSFSNRSPLEILLEPAADEAGHGEESDDMLVLDPDNEKDGCSLSPRSVSSLSLSSTPSLDAANSTLDTVDTRTPSASPRKSPFERKEKAVSSPPKEEISLDEHPLRPTSPTEPAPWNPKALPTLSRPAPKPKSTLTSNLTASLLALKTAAKSFSNFTAPSLPPDDLLTRSILSPATLGRKYPPEMRPKTISGVPDAAMRRYMNPTTYAPSKKREEPQVFPSLSASCPDSERAWRRALSRPLAAEGEEGWDEDEEEQGPMIQMKTYSSSSSLSSTSRTRKRSQRSSFLGPDRAEAAVLAQSPTGTVRQREPRENSDFLRVIVLEMNMRRTGKLDAKAGGKARVWLPPRTDSAPIDEGNGKVPVRWVGVSVED